MPVAGEYKCSHLARGKRLPDAFYGFAHCRQTAASAKLQSSTSLMHQQPWLLCEQEMWLQPSLEVPSVSNPLIKSAPRYAELRDKKEKESSSPQ